MESKKRELTDMQKAFIEALFSLESQGKPVLAKRIAGYSDKVSSAELIRSLHEEIVEYGKKYLATHSASAVLAMLDVLDNPSAAGSVTKLKAASEIMNRVGLAKQDDNGLKLPENGLVILPAKSIKIELNDIEPDTSEG